MSTEKNRFERRSARWGLFFAALIVAAPIGWYLWHTPLDRALPDSIRRLLPRRPGADSREGSGEGIPSVFLQGHPRTDELRGFVYEPHTIFRQYYPDNPRGYFLEEPAAMKAWRRAWVLQTPENSPAHMSVETEDGIGAKLVVAPGMVDEKQPWMVCLASPAVNLDAGQTSEIRIKARASEPRDVALVVQLPKKKTAIAKSWSSLRVGTTWRSYKIQAPAPDANEEAMLMLNVAQSQAPLELAEVTWAANGKTLFEAPGKAGEKAYYVEFKMNEAGFRDDEFVSDKPIDTTRIAVLGDSLAMGMGVHQEDTFCQRLETALSREGDSKEPKRKYDVMNFGVTGYSTGEERACYEQVVSGYKPDVVVLAMYWNDAVGWHEQSKIPFNPTAQPAEYGEALKKLLDQTGFDPCIAEAKRLAELVAADGARFLVVLFNYDTTVESLRMVDSVAKPLADAGFAVLDLGPKFQEHGLAGNCAAHRLDGHPSEAAHAIAAQAIEEKLRAEGMLPDAGDEATVSAANDAAAERSEPSESSTGEAPEQTPPPEASSNESASPN